MKQFVILNVFLCVIHTAQPQGLNNYVDILHYDIHLNITDFENEYIFGYTDITLVSYIELNSFTFNLKALKVDSVVFENGDQSEFFQKRSELEIVSSKTYGPGDTLAIQIWYGGNPVRDPLWGGFFFEEGYAFNMGVGMASETKSFGQVWYPCVDDFTEKASYDFFIETKPEHLAVCSGQFVDSVSTQDNTQIFHWEETMPIPAYVSSVAVGEYDVIKYVYEGLQSDIPVELYMRPLLYVDIQKSFGNLRKCLEGFETQFGPYVWKRVGYVTVPFSSGAMEHNCNIAYPEYAVDGTLERETLMAHELSHHWFGNLVTCARPQDMWLNEGWASYSEALFTEYVYGRDAYTEYVRNNHYNVLNYAHLYDRGYYPVAGVPSELTYGTTVYDKGADMIHTLRTYMGDSLFFKTTKAYIRHFMFKSVTTEDFKNFWQTFSGMALSDFFDTWIYEAGFPHFSISDYSSEYRNKKWEIFFTVRQRLKARENYADSVPMQVVFFDENLSEFKMTVYASGKYTDCELTLDFKPKFWVLNPEGEISDATIRQKIEIKKAGEHKFTSLQSVFNVPNLEQPEIIYAQNHNLAPDDLPEAYSAFQEGCWKFVSKPGTLEGTKLRMWSLFPLFIDSDITKVVLYRPDINSEWEEIDFSMVKNVENPTFEMDYQAGLYCPAVKQ